MQLSVIILNYNVKSFLEVCIKSVKKAISDIDAEIIVVDNASNDGSKEMMQQIFPDVTYLYQKDNLGFPKGNNIGVSVAKGEFICILNPDTIVAENTFTLLIREYFKLENPGILGCKLIDGSGNFLPESKRGVPTPWVALTKVLSLYKLFPKNKRFNQYYAQHINENQSGEVDILVGAFMFMKKEIYLKVGGFDEGCFMYADDIDLSYLIKKQELKNYYISSTTVIHFKGESTLKDGKYMNRFKQAMQFFYQKHFKKSFWFSLFMDIGIALFAFKKKTEVFENNFEINQYILVSNNANIYQNLTSKILKPVDWVANLQDVITLNNPKKNVEILVDAEQVSYKEYIDFINKHANKNLTFKIRSEYSDFFIGSNNKNDKGTVLNISL